MNNAINVVINHFKRKPRILFLVDSLGAALTTFFLFIILRDLHVFSGMPKNILTYLSVVALVFCTYSAACFFLLTGNWTPFIRAISIANLLYCVLTMAFIWVYFNQLTTLGFTYFFIEIALLFALVYIELKVATAVK
jgi:hypothetical protein